MGKKGVLKEMSFETLKEGVLNKGWTLYNPWTLDSIQNKLKDGLILKEIVDGVVICGKTTSEYFVKVVFKPYKEVRKLLKEGTSYHYLKTTLKKVNPNQMFFIERFDEINNHFYFLISGIKQAFYPSPSFKNATAKMATEKLRVFVEMNRQRIIFKQFEFDGKIYNRYYLKKKQKTDNAK